MHPVVLWTWRTSFVTWNVVLCRPKPADRVSHPPRGFVVDLALASGRQCAEMTISRATLQWFDETR